MRLTYLLAGLLCLGSQPPPSAQNKPPVLRSVEFVHIAPVSFEEISNRLDERDVDMRVERPYHKENVTQAEKLIDELLAEKGRADLSVKAAVIPVPPNGVRIVFAAKRMR